MAGGAIPELVIPVRFDISKIPGLLNKVGAAGQKAGDDTDKGFKKARGSSDALASSLTGLIKAQIGLAAIKATATAIASQYRETSQYIMQMSKDFQGLRKSMQEVAALKGQPNTNQFTLEEAKKGQQYNLTPQEYKNFQAEFQNYAGSQVGGANGKLTSAQGEEYAGRVAEMMKAFGVDPAVGAELAGSLLENSKGPQNVDDLMKRIGTSFNVLQKGRVPLKQALPQMSQIMAHGVEMEEAAQMFSIVSPASPREPGVAVEASMRAINEMKAKGTGEEFGVKRGMSQFESVKAFAENINKRKKDSVAAGRTEQEAQDDLAALLLERKVVNDVREGRGLIAGFGRQGVELGAFKTYGDIAKDTPADFEAKAKKTYEESQQGRQDKIDVADAVSQAEMGERNEEVLKRRQIAEVELRDAGRFEHPLAMDRAKALLPYSDDMKEQQINRQAIARARGERGEEVSSRDNAISQNTALTNELLRDLIKTMKARDAGKPGAPPVKPLMPKPEVRP